MSREEAVRLAKRFGLVGVYETSAKYEEQEALSKGLATVDDVIFRSVVNCFDFKQNEDDDKKQMPSDLYPSSIRP